MPPSNKHLQNSIGDYYQNNTMQVVIHTFFICSKHWFPSLTIEEISLACIKFYDLDEDLYSTQTVISTYYRVDKDLTNLKKQKDKIKAYPIKTS